MSVLSSVLIRAVLNELNKILNEQRVVRKWDVWQWLFLKGQQPLMSVINVNERTKRTEKTTHCS